MNGPVGVKLALPINSKVPPVAEVYQSTVLPGSVVTVSAGIGAPSQIIGLFGVVGAFTGAQLQFGAFTDCTNWQPVVVLVLEMSTLVPAVIPLMVKLPALPVTVPAVAVTMVPLVLIITL